jgi:hypothetical protein
VLFSLYCAPVGELWCTGAAGGPTLVSAPLENNLLINIFENFAKKPLCFFEINPRSSFADFALKPLYFSKINPQSVILQLGPRI